MQHEFWFNLTRNFWITFMRFFFCIKNWNIVHHFFFCFFWCSNSLARCWLPTVTLAVQLKWFPIFARFYHCQNSTEARINHQQFSAYARRFHVIRELRERTMRTIVTKRSAFPPATRAFWRWPNFITQPRSLYSTPERSVSAGNECSTNYLKDFICAHPTAFPPVVI